MCRDWHTRYRCIIFYVCWHTRHQQSVTARLAKPPAVRFVWGPWLIRDPFICVRWLTRVCQARRVCMCVYVCVRVCVCVCMCVWGMKCVYVCDKSASVLTHKKWAGCNRVCGTPVHNQFSMTTCACFSDDCTYQVSIYLSICLYTSFCLNLFRCIHVICIELYAHIVLYAHIRTYSRVAWVCAICMALKLTLSTRISYG